MTRPMDPSIHQAWEFAYGEASELGHGYIGTEHLLLGILKEAKGKLANILREIHVDYAAAKTEIERFISPVPATALVGQVPLTPRAKKALKVAAREAKAMKDPAVAAEHLFLGLLLEGDGIAARALRNLGVTEQTIRQEIVPRRLH